MKNIAGLVVRKMDELDQQETVYTAETVIKSDKKSEDQLMIQGVF